MVFEKIYVYKLSYINADFTAIMLM